MKARLRAVRIAPKKVDLIAKMVRGMTVPEALTALERTNKRAARFLERLLQSAVANASHNDRQDAKDLVITSLKVDKAQAYNRGVPMARGRVRPIRKFMSHVEITLGIAGEGALGEGAGKAQKAAKAVKAKKENSSKAFRASSSSKASVPSSQTPEKPVQRKRTKGSARKSVEETALPKSTSSQ